MKESVIWHSTDIHSHYTAFASLVGCMNQQRHADDLFLDSGDFCDWQDPMINGTDGIGGMRLLRAAGADAMSVGNNEFLASFQTLENMSRCGVPLLSCNLSGTEGNRIGLVCPSLVLARGGIRYLIIGCSPYWGDTTRNTSFMDLAGIRTDNPIDLINRELTARRGQYDVSILLSHAGNRRDMVIAENVTGLDLILSGHSHRPLNEKVNQTWLHNCGCYGESIGRLLLVTDDQKKLCQVEAVDIPNEFPPDPRMMALLRNQTEIGLQALSAPLYEIPAELGYQAFSECRSVNALCDAMHMKYGGDMALINNGVLNGSLGPSISKLLLLKTAPSGLRPTSVLWKGKQIRQAVRASQTETERIHSSGKGAGFRGHVLGTLSFSSNVTVYPYRDRILINGSPLDDAHIYHVITDDYLRRGSGYEMLGESLGQTDYYSGYLRDLLAEMLKDPEVLRRSAIRRTKDE